MNQQTFVDSIRRHVRDAAVEGVLSILKRPPGRRPAQELLDLSAWYQRLADDDKARIERVLALVAHQVVFGLFAVVDGARTIEEQPGPKGRFELRHVSPSGDVTTIAGDGLAPLHELL